MPLDILAFRAHEGGNPEAIRESQRRRFASVEAVDEIIAKDEKWRYMTGALDLMRKEKNQLNKQVGTKMKAKEPCDELIAQGKAMGEKILTTEAEQKALRVEIDKLIVKIGNIVDSSVPVGKDEDLHNKVERTWGVPRDPTGLLNHHDLLWRIGGYEPERGQVVAGHRGYFLKGVGVLLNQALINYSIAFLSKREYTPIQPPYMMNKDIMSGVAQLEEFDEALYKVSGGEDDGSNDKYLIATSEQPICAYHKDEWMNEKTLPIRYAGVSTCFRKEAGSSGRDCWGIFRVHQFEKVEQFVICEDNLEVSNAHQEEMAKCAEQFLQSLGFPYQVVNICSGGLNNAAIRKYDIECWFPGYNAYRELVSCSNCTDYQSRSMEIRCGTQRKMGEREKRYVHMLNSTLCATGRAICCLLETYQEADGVRVPEVLVPFMGGITFMPFVRDSKAPDTAAPTKGPVKPNVAAKPPAAAVPEPVPAPPAAKVTPEKKTSLPAAPKLSTSAAIANLSSVAQKVVADIDQIGGKIREMKAAKADKNDIQVEVQKLLAAKAEYKSITGDDFKIAPAAGAASVEGPGKEEKVKKEAIVDLSKPPREPVLPPKYVTPAPGVVKKATSAGATATSTASIPSAAECILNGSVNMSALNDRLAFYSYLGGYRPSAADAAAFAAIEAAAAAAVKQCEQNINVARWFRSIDSFSTEERAQWQ